MATNMTIKGQVLIPKHVREAAGLVPGRPVHVDLNEAGEAVVRPVIVPQDTQEARRLDMRARIERVQALFRAQSKDDGMTTDDYMALIREPLP